MPPELFPRVFLPSTPPAVSVEIAPYNAAEIAQERVNFTKMCEFAVEHRLDLKAVCAFWQLCLTVVRARSDPGFVAFLGAQMGLSDPAEIVRRAELFIAHVLASEPVSDSQVTI